MFFGRGDFWESDLQERFFKYNQTSSFFIYIIYNIYIFKSSKILNVFKSLGLINETKTLRIINFCGNFVILFLVSNLRIDLCSIDLNIKKHHGMHYFYQ